MTDQETQKLTEDLKRAFEKHHLLNDCIITDSTGEILINRNHWTKTAIGYLIDITDATDCNFRLTPAGFHLFR